MPPSKNGKQPQRENFTMIPNILDTMELNPYDFRLYFHIKMVVGEDPPEYDNEHLSRGVCMQSAGVLAKVCRMSEPVLVATKERLTKAGLIYIAPHEKGSREPHSIRIVKVWRKNHAMFHQVALPSIPVPSGQPGDLRNLPPANLVTCPANLVTCDVSAPDTSKKGRKERKERKEEDEASAETASAPPTTIPEEFQTISDLPGYTQGTHAKAFENIKKACAAAGVSAEDVVTGFAFYYNAHRFRLGWKDPVRVLSNTIHIEIAKVLRAKENRGVKHGRSNGVSRPDSDPYLQQAENERLRRIAGGDSAHAPPLSLPTLPGERVDIGRPAAPT